MSNFFPLFFGVLAGVVGAYFAAWVVGRLWSARCPNCGGKWQTELTEDGNLQQWYCHGCYYQWAEPIEPNSFEGSDADER